MSTYRKEYYLRNREKLIAYQLEYYKRTNTHEKILKQREYNAKYYLNNKHKWNKRVANKKINERPKTVIKENKNENIEYKEPNFWIKF